MGLWDFVKGELIDIIQWQDEGADALVHRFDGHDNEIKNGAQLIVRPGQAAVFVNQGEIADVFGPGRHELHTQNLPVLSRLQGWKYGFESPFKADVFFVSTRQMTDQKWGTKTPIMMRDPEFGPVRVKAFGTYVLRVAEPAKFVAQLVGASGAFGTGDVGEQLRSMVVSQFADALGEAHVPVLDLAARYNEVGAQIRDRMAPDIADLGLELTRFVIESISLPDEVTAALDRRSSMGVVGDLNAYTRFQTAEAIRESAHTPGSAAGEGMGLGMGFAMAQQMAQAVGGLGTQPQGAPPGAPPPLPQAAAWFAAIGGKQTGPHAADALRQQVASGAVTRDTLVWKQGMSGWTPAGQVDELAPLFAAVPPPLPPE